MKEIKDVLPMPPVGSDLLSYKEFSFYVALYTPDIEVADGEYTFVDSNNNTMHYSRKYGMFFIYTKDRDYNESYINDNGEYTYNKVSIKHIIFDRVVDLFNISVDGDFRNYIKTIYFVVNNLFIEDWSYLFGTNDDNDHFNFKIVFQNRVNGPHTICHEYSSHDTTTEGMFKNFNGEIKCIYNFDSSKANNTSYMFYNFNPSNLKEVQDELNSVINHSGGFGGTRNIDYMFYGSKFTEIDLGNAYFTNVKTSEYAFANMPDVVKIKLNNFGLNNTNLNSAKMMFSDNYMLEHLEVGDLSIYPDGTNYNYNGLYGLLSCSNGDNGKIKELTIENKIRIDSKSNLNNFMKYNATEVFLFDIFNIVNYDGIDNPNNRTGLTIRNFAAYSNKLKEIDFTALKNIYIADMSSLVDSCNNLEKINGMEAINIDSNSIMDKCLYGVLNLKDLKLGSQNTCEPSVYHMIENSSIKNLSVHNINNFHLNMQFIDKSVIENVSITSDNVSTTIEQINIKNAFMGAQYLKVCDISGLKTGSYIAEGLFDGCNRLEWITLPNITSIGVEPNQTFGSVSRMFSGCWNLKELPARIGSIDMTQVNDFSYMFNQCYELKKIDLSNITIASNANTDMRYMFGNLVVDCMGETVLYFPVLENNTGIKIDNIIIAPAFVHMDTPLQTGTGMFVFEDQSLGDVDEFIETGIIKCRQ